MKLKFVIILFIVLIASCSLQSQSYNGAKIRKISDGLERNISIYQDHHQGPYKFECQGASLKRMLDFLIKHTNHENEWISGIENLPDGVYEICFGKKSWNNKENLWSDVIAALKECFNLDISIHDMEWNAKLLSIDSDRKVLIKSNEQNKSIKTDVEDGKFGMKFSGISMEEFSEWLRENTSEPIVNNTNLPGRYDLFIEYKEYSPNLIKGTEKNGFYFEQGKVNKRSIVIRKNANI